MGRSYGDVALNADNRLLLTRRLDALVEADWSTGRIIAGAGLTIGGLHAVSLDRGWICPVMPGTQFASLGGCVANDIHGKNHRSVGSFGAHVLRLKLRRSDGTAICSRETRPDLFALTLGGLGLTGLIEWVELQLAPLSAPQLEEEIVAFEALDDYLALDQASADWPYTAAWLDCTSRGARRGLFSRARPAVTPGRVSRTRSFRLPVTMPSWTISRPTITAFNRLYHFVNRRGGTSIRPIEAVLHPLDALRDWNRLFGRSGMLQYQAIFPQETARAGLGRLLDAAADAAQPPSLAVLKGHGDPRSPGVLSFCRPGFSLALDYANRGGGTRSLFEIFDAIVDAHGGRLYSAKDGRMSAALFQNTYPRWRELEDARDPAFSSSFWRRVATAEVA